MNLIKKSAFAEKIGVSRAGITQACQSKNLTLVADENGFIDLDAQTTKDYLSNRKNKKPRKPIERSAQKLVKTRRPIDIDFGSVTKEQIEEAGGPAIFKLYCDIEKTRVDTELKKIKTAEQRGELINKKLQADYIFYIIDALNKRLLNSPLQFVDRLIAFAEKDGSLARGKIIEIWTGEISNAIKTAIMESKKCLKK